MEQFLKHIVDILWLYHFGDIGFDDIPQNIKLAARNSAIPITDEECLNIRNYIGQKLRECATKNLDF